MENLVKYIQILQPYYKWRIESIKRENYRCQNCGKEGRLKTVLSFPKLPVLYVMHIKSLNDIIKENNITNEKEARACKALWDISNGKVLCTECYYKEQKRKIALKFLKK